MSTWFKTIYTKWNRYRKIISRFIKTCLKPNVIQRKSGLIKMLLLRIRNNFVLEVFLRSYFPCKSSRSHNLKFSFGTLLAGFSHMPELHQQQVHASTVEWCSLEFISHSIQLETLFIWRFIWNIHRWVGTFNGGLHKRSECGVIYGNQGRWVLPARRHRSKIIPSLVESVVKGGVLRLWI